MHPSDEDGASQTLASFRPGVSAEDLFKSGEEKGYSHINQLFASDSLQIEILRLTLCSKPSPSDTSRVATSERCVGVLGRGGAPRQAARRHARGPGASGLHVAAPHGQWRVVHAAARSEQGGQRPDGAGRAEGGEGRR